MKKVYSVDVRVADIGRPFKFKNLSPNETFSLTINYPVEGSIDFKFNTGPEGMSYPELVSKIGKCYKTIYKNPEKYGVWGHGIGDLFLEQIHVDYKNNTVKLYVGS